MECQDRAGIGFLTPGAGEEEGGHLLRTLDGNFHHLQKQ